jgi:hypothetical protein
METDSTIEITAFGSLSDGDIFLASPRNGLPFLAMKVATRQTRDDHPSHDVLVFSQDKPPALFNDRYLDGKPIAKIKDLVFTVQPKKASDLILVLDVQNGGPRVRGGAGCVYLIGDDVFLGAVVKQQGPDAEKTYFVNVKTGECWHDATVGTLNMRGSSGSSQRNLLMQAGAVPSWRITETSGDKNTWVAYEVPGAQASNAA